MDKIVIRELETPDDKGGMIFIKSSYIGLLAKYMSKGRCEDDPDLMKLDFLDEVFEETYKSLRIKAGFEQASRMANIKVINTILLGEHENLA